MGQLVKEGLNTVLSTNLNSDNTNRQEKTSIEMYIIKIGIC